MIRKVSYKLLLLLACCVVLGACSPNNLADCYIEVAKAPTEKGVFLGTKACEMKFPPK